MKTTAIPLDVYEKYAGIVLGNGSMIKLNVNFFYDFGSHLNPIVENYANEENVFDIYFHAIYVKDNLESLFKAFPWMDVCKNAAPELVTAIDDCVNAYNEYKKEEKTTDSKKQRHLPYEFHTLREKAQAFQTVLAAELRTLEAYVTTQKGAYDTTDLIENAEILFPESIRNKIDDKVIEDVRCGARCLAFDNPTASGFHILRATEAVLKQYYLTICKPDPIPKKLGSWGWADYIGALYKSTDSQVKKMVAVLQQIKDLDRNLVAHPEIFLSEDEAFILFDAAKYAIMQMASRLPEIKRGK